MGHGHFVRLHENISGHPQVHIDILHPAYRVQMGRLLVIIAGNLHRIPVVAQQFMVHANQLRLHVLGVDFGIPQKPLLQRRRSPQQIVAALHAGRQHREQPVQGTLHAKGHPLHGTQRLRLPVDPVTSEQLVRPFTGQYHRHMLAGQLGHMVQGNG
ncbi:hypothetical protein D3C75_722560 [compost metagenome]